MGQRSRKRGRREKPTPVAVAASGRLSRSERKDAAVRATLTPLAPGERPWPLIVGAALAALSGLVQLILFLVGVRLKSSGLKASAGQTIAFAVLMFICAAGMWTMRYWAVLGFMALLAILILFAVGSLIKASTILGAVIAVVIVGLGGYLFFKLVRVLSRIQMPKYPGN
ncbi:MAG TPA: hypothetical protein VMD09_16735 [Solirubrobacteraceae bacterium]|nr:hypothetical protein [Solirubrobacteraceae bacterium]